MSLMKESKRNETNINSRRLAIASMLNRGYRGHIGGIQEALVN